MDEQSNIVLIPEAKNHHVEHAESELNDEKSNVNLGQETIKKQKKQRKKKQRTRKVWSLNGAKN